MYDVKTAKISPCSPTVAERGLRMTTTLDLDGVERVLEAASLDREATDQAQRVVSETHAWILEDGQRTARFQRAPLTTLCERHPGLVNRLPDGMVDGLDGDAGLGTCVEMPDLQAATPCVVEILRRVARWVARSPSNEAVYRADVDAAVDRVALQAPAVARTLAKEAIRKSRAHWASV